MQIVFAAAEVAPFAKVGGLADVAGSLPQALASLGHELTVYLPLHRTIDRARHGIPADGPVRSVPYGAARVRIAYPSLTRDGVRFVFVESDRKIGREKVYGMPDDDRRYSLFCRAVAEDIAAGPPPDIVHAHDWHAALLVPMVGRSQERLKGTATVFTIHNLAYQGRTADRILRLVGLPAERLPVEKPGECNPMARGIAAADIVSTVSERYAQEILAPEFGEGLQGLLGSRRDDLYGIVNGIDTTFFDPATDPHIAARYDAQDQSGKAASKEALQRESGLRVDAKAPLFGVIGRLVEQKGIDLLTAAAPALLGAGGQLVVLGTGDASYEDKWRAFAQEHEQELSLTLGFDAALAQRIYAGADLFLMPSRFEPCGLGQLISLRYGTIPVVRAVGGLADTVRDLDRDPARGNGFSFAEYTPAAFADAITRAIRAFRGATDWPAVRARAMREDHSWGASAARYVEMYRTAAEARRAA
ncbi:MAG TPA: glycogen/starch synthase [Candidatus Limnocylindrales bacterium]|nr:glycogen/starch synthase [Candidatus Limnocylindrales bacterium]